jgi:hypothetical protein
MERPWNPCSIWSLSSEEVIELDLNAFLVMRLTEENLRPDSDDALFVNTYRWVFFGNPFSSFFFDDMCEAAGSSGSEMRRIYLERYPGISHRYDRLLGF